MKKYKNYLKSFFKDVKNDEEGAGVYILLMVFILVILMISSVVFEYMRIKNNLSDVKSSLENSLVSYATDNWDEIYKSTREGYSGGYKLDDERSLNWIENLDSSKIKSELISELKLNRLLEKEVGSEVAYKISDINTYIENVRFKDTNSNLYIISEVTVEIPIIMGFKNSPAFSVKLKARSRYQNKF